MDAFHLASFDWTRVFELLITAVFFVVGIYLKDRITHATTKQKITSLENTFKEHREKVDDELTKLDTTLSTTNQTLAALNASNAALNATVQGLSGWLKRVDERQYNEK